MEVGTNIKIIIGIIVILVFGFIVGFITFEVLTAESPDIEGEKQIVKPDARRITTSRFVERTPKIATEIQHTEPKLNPPKPERILCQKEYLLPKAAMMKSRISLLGFRYRLSGRTPLKK